MSATQTDFRPVVEIPSDIRPDGCRPERRILMGEPETRDIYWCKAKAIDRGFVTTFEVDQANLLRRRISHSRQSTPQISPMSQVISTRSNCLSGVPDK